jgi:hypothetical protein
LNLLSFAELDESLKPDSPMEATDHSRLKVSELKALLAERGLDGNGKKAQLVERLKEALASEDNSDDNDKDDSEKDVDLEEYDESDGDGDEEEEEQGNLNEVATDEPSASLTTARDQLKAAGGFEGHEFVTKSDKCISFELHAPTPKKPQPKPTPSPPSDESKVCS